MGTTTLHIQCHCKFVAFEIPIDSESFPLSSAFCHCNPCRYSTGQLAASFAVIPVDPGTLNLDASHLSRYATSEHRTRYFCPNCGASVLDFADSDGKWRACTGVLDRTQGLLNRDQIFIGDTQDLGLSIWLSNVGKMVTAGPESNKVGVRAMIPPAPTSDLPADARLHGSCHCGGVLFDILPPLGGKRYTAGIDTCTSCRLTAGFELTSWTSIPLTQTHMPDGTPLDLSRGKLKRYNSSNGVYRYFCSRCGAKVFVAKDNQSWIDIAVGLLRAEEGARAEKWLNWTELGFGEEATDQELLVKLSENFKQWTRDRDSYVQQTSD